MCRSTWSEKLQLDLAWRHVTHREPSMAGDAESAKIVVVMVSEREWVAFMGKGHWSKEDVIERSTSMGQSQAEAMFPEYAAKFIYFGGDALAEVFEPRVTEGGDNPTNSTTPMTRALMIRINNTHRQLRTLPAGIADKAIRKARSHNIRWPMCGVEYHALLTSIEEGLIGKGMAKLADG